jgi:hypothetical protein
MKDINKIPKKIFYVWSIYDDTFYNVFSKNISLKTARICYLSWERFLKSYEIVEVNENIFDYDKHYNNNKFFKIVVDNKMWAFISDYVRVHILYKYGGIYLDTDVQVLKNFDKFLRNDFFISLQHWKIDGRYCVEPAVMGCSKEHPFLERIIRFYNKDFWNYKETSIPEIFSICLKEMYGFYGISREVIKSNYKGDIGAEFSSFPDEYFSQKIIKLKNINIYPENYFCPKWMSSDKSIQAPGIKSITKNTVTIHWNNCSWLGYNSLKKLSFLKSMKKVTL